MNTISEQVPNVLNWMMMDMDSFFASAEQSFRPELRGRPVGVIPVETDTTCLIAASYDAKRLGIKTGTSVREARRLCPAIKLIKARPKLYVEVHNRILQSVDKCAPVEKVYSIDEWTFRLRGEDKHPSRALELAREIKRQLLADFDPWLSSSIGIASSRLLAKIASGLQKPNGLTVLPVEDMPDRISHLSLKSLCGIGDGMLSRLNRHGILTIQDLWGLSRSQSVQVWGSIAGAQWWAGFHGIDEPEAATHRRSMTHGNVLEPKFRNSEGARSILIRLICKLAHRLRRDGYFSKVMSISTVDIYGNRHVDKISLPCANDTLTLLQQFGKIWQRRAESSVPIKKVDVCVGELVVKSQVANSLFDEIEKLQRASMAIDQINQRLGAQSIYVGAIHHCRQHMDNKIAFGRIPDEAEG
ncbi:MAG: Y-family DNA polymerase [Planctomycetaceae bacterium]